MARPDGEDRKDKIGTPMKLYLSPGACSLSVHIALIEAGLPFTTESVDLKTKVTASGADYTAINPKGSAPALETDEGLLTECAVLLQYVADKAPGSGLAPPAGGFDRYRLLEMLNFVSSEIHKGLGAFFNPAMTPDWRAGIEPRLARALNVVEGVLNAQPYLTGQTFTVADAYLFTVLNWAGWVKFDLSPWPAALAFQARVAARPSVQAALKAEGLAPS